MEDKSILFPVKRKHSIDCWPSPLILNGHPYKNGVAIYEKKNIVLKPHNPDFLHPYEIQANYKLSSELTLENHALLSDLSNGKVESLNLLRLMVFQSLVTGYGNASFYIYGPAGGAKTTLVQIFSNFYPRHAFGAMDDASLKKTTTVKATLVKGKHLVFINDIANSNFTGTSVEFCKTVTGRDMIVSDQKYKSALNFINHGRLILTSNVNPFDLKAFQDPGFNQRFIRLTVPGIDSKKRVADIGLSFDNNRQNLIHWFMTINKELVEKSIRADGINSAVGSNLSEMDEFFLHSLVFEENHHLSTKQISDAYVAFKTELGEFDERKKNLINSEVGKAIVDFSRRVDFTY